MGNNTTDNTLAGRWTSGPWVAGFGHQHAFRVYAGSLDGPKVADCNVTGGVSGGAEGVQANAQLIAAAPDLYIALLAIEEYILQDGEYAAGTFSRALQDAALKALAKARGEVTK